MIARLFVHLKPGVYIPEGELYNPCDYEDDGCTIREYYPVRSTNADIEATTDGLTINGVAAFHADTLKFDILKPTFSFISGGSPDPSDEFLGRVVNFYLIRLRHVTRAGHIRPVNFPLSARTAFVRPEDEAARLGVSVGRQQHICLTLPQSRSTN